MRTTVACLALASLTTLPALAASADANAARSRTLRDAEVLSVLQTIDLGEVTEARNALDRASDQSVRSFLQLMVRDHSKGLRDIKSVAHDLGTSGQPSTLSHALAMQQREDSQSFENLSGQSFDTKFMQHEVQEHTRTLRIIDKQLMPAAQSQAVMDLLQSHRATVVKHIQAARQVLDRLGNGNGGNGG